MAAIFRYCIVYNYVCTIIAFVNFQEIKEISIGFFIETCSMHVGPCRSVCVEIDRMVLSSLQIKLFTSSVQYNMSVIVNDGTFVVSKQNRRSNDW